MERLDNGQASPGANAKDLSVDAKTNAAKNVVLLD
jgi:hypothetical protein